MFRSRSQNRPFEVGAGGTVEAYINSSEASVFEVLGHGLEQDSVGGQCQLVNAFNIREELDEVDDIFTYERFTAGESNFTNAIGCE